MKRLLNSGLVNVRQLFWLRCLAIVGQLVSIGVVQGLLGVRLPFFGMLTVIALEAGFNAMTLWRFSHARAAPETDAELVGQLLIDLSTLTALLFMSGGTTNPFASLYLPSLAIAAAVLPWHLALWLTLLSAGCYVLLGFYSLPLELVDPERLFQYYLAGMCVNFLVSVGLIAWFVARMSRALRLRDAVLADAQQRLLRDERVVALGAQAASVAHEMGTPLSTIAMLAEELKAQADSDVALGAYAGDFELLERQIGVCRSALARLQSRAAVPVSDRPRIAIWLDAFVTEWRLRQPQVNFHLLRVEETGETVLEDPVATGWILTILLDNAARASPGWVSLEVYQARDAVYFEVVDRGPGIPVALREQLGEAPVRSTEGGQGVGLYLALATAARLAGQIELSDSPGGGTRAALRLPAHSVVPSAR